MPFNTAFNSVAYQDSTVASIIIGTCQLATLNTFGQVMSANLTRVGDTREVKDCRNRLRAFLIENAALELDFECLFDSEVAAPEMGDIITFPLVAVHGIILPGTQIKWTSGGERMISIKAKSWDHMRLHGALMAYDPTTGSFVHIDSSS